MRPSAWVTAEVLAELAGGLGKLPNPGDSLEPIDLSAGWDSARPARVDFGNRGLPPRLMDGRHRVALLVLTGRGGEFVPVAPLSRARREPRVRRG